MSGAELFDLSVAGERVDARWWGRWEEATAESYVSALERVYASEKVRHLVVDATGLEQCSILARGRLTDLQEALRGSHERCAYVASSPRIRGLCLWIVKVAGDANGAVFARFDDVDGWLDTSEGRFENAKRRANRAFERLAEDRRS